MSNNNYLSSRTQESETSWNISQLCKGVAFVSGTIVFILANSHLKEAKKDTPQNITQPDIVEAFVDNKKTFQGLAVIRVGNLEEMNTLKSSGKDGWYMFQEGNTITYLKVQSGITEFNTYTLTQ